MNRANVKAAVNRTSRPGKADHRARSLSSGTYLLIILTLVLGLFVSSRQAQIARLSYDLAEFKGDLAQLEAEVELARLEVAQLRSIERIERVAELELGMQRPEVVRLVVVPATEEEPTVAIASAGTPGVAEAAAREAAAASNEGLAGVVNRLLPILGRAEAKSRE